jgi:hypothetical protein
MCCGHAQVDHTPRVGGVDDAETGTNDGLELPAEPVHPPELVLPPPLILPPEPEGSTELVLPPPLALPPEPYAGHEAATGSAVAEAETTGPLGNLVAAHFQRVEIAMLGRILTTTLVGALPATMVRVERRRTLLERLLRRPGVAIGVGVSFDDQLLTFRAPDVGVTEASVGHIVGGVVLSSKKVPVAEWLTLLGDMLDHATQDDEAARTALERALLP